MNGASSPFFEVVAPGLETSVQELPGRLGYWEQGFPPSGPADVWSFRLANLLVGNPRDTAALECQFWGRPCASCAMARSRSPAPRCRPSLTASPSRCGDHPGPNGQVLACTGARTGARIYIAFAGGIDTPPVLGSRATFHMAGVGGVDGYALKAGQAIAPVAGADVTAPGGPRGSARSAHHDRTSGDGRGHARPER